MNDLSSSDQSAGPASLVQQRQRFAVFCLCITLCGGAGARLLAQGVIPAVPPSPTPGNTGISTDLPEDPAFADGSAPYPLAVETARAGAEHIRIKAMTQSSHGSHVVLDGDVEIVDGSMTVQADHIDYDRDTGNLEATGHLRLRGGKSAEQMSASRGTLNLRNNTGRFYDVTGSVGLKTGGNGRIYTVGNPFLFEGRLVVKNGPDDYDIYEGSVTSCQLPHPDWRLTSAHFMVHSGRASAHGTLFRLRNIPILYLPFVTHPVPEQGADQRQSGFLIPVIGQSSTKGLVLGEQIYFVLNRSTDLTVGSEYFSKRGWQQTATLRYKGQGLDFGYAHFSNLLDRGYYGTILGQGSNGAVTSTIGYINQGGEDIVLNGRKDFSSHTRIAGDAEYLSAYAYRQAFTDNFNQAVTTDIVSSAYGTHEVNGYVAALEADRYQGLKRTLTGEQVRILHAPQLDLQAMEHRLGNSPLLWSAQLQSSAIKRTQGTGTSSSQLNTGFVERLDVRPELSLPLSLGGFRLRSSVAVRDTYYTNSRSPVPLPGTALPLERNQSLNRTSMEADVELRTPVLERTFEGGPFSRLLGRSVKHTIEPEAHYRYVTGVDSFDYTPRFDPVDVLSNTNELEYGVTQRLFLRPSRIRPCEEGEIPQDGTGDAITAAGTAVPENGPAGLGPASGRAASPMHDGTRVNSVGITASADDAAAAEKEPTCGGTRESLRWRIVQRFYGNDTFGKTVLISNRRNVLATTLDLSGVAFLTSPRSFSPIVSEMRLSATSHLDMEWDMNYDTQLDKFTQSNVFLNYHAKDYFGGLSYARLNAPGRFQRLDTATTASNTTSLLSDFSQLRLLVGYGTPTKQGFSVATNVGLDLTVPQPQYGALQMAYNWNCCGISGEYRKFELGSVRNENVYRFNFTLANIGSAGNLRRAERLF